MTATTDATPAARALPATEAEWREFALGAAALLLLDDARLYGLIDGGPDIDRDQCEAALAAAAQRGIEIPIEQATRTAIEFCDAHNHHAAEAARA